MAIILLIASFFETTDCFASTLATQQAEDSLRVTQLDELVVNKKKEKYSKKNNPAYELMKRIRENMSLGDPEKEQTYSYNFYDKLSLGVNEYDMRAITAKNQYRFMQDYVDTTITPAFPVLMLSLREKAGTHLHSNLPRYDKRVVEAQRSVGIDDGFDQRNINEVLDDVLRNTDIYGNDIILMQNRFVSPLSRIADDYYKYSLGDTITEDGERYVELIFVPKTPESFGFNGRMFVAFEDSTYFIRRVNMRVPRVINLNYIDNIYINQEYIKDSDGKRHKSLDDMSLELQLMPATPTFFARRVTTNSNFSYRPHDNFEKFVNSLGATFVVPNADKQPWDIWDRFRPMPLNPVEQQMGSFITRLRKIPFFYWSEKVLKVLVNGYISTGPNSKVDIGPVNTLISYNSIEGVRLRLGGVTTGALSPHWFARGYVAYGCKDRKWKYNIALEYSLLPKKLHAGEFPVNALRLHYTYDLDMIGQKYLFTNPDNVFLSLKRKSSKLALYKRDSGVDYQLELRNNFSLQAGFTHSIYESTPWLPFVYPDGRMDSKYTLADLHLTLRYAPGEKFYQARSMRVPVNQDAWVFLLTHKIAPKRMLGSAFTLNVTEATVQKRFWMSAFGYMDFLLKGGKIWSKVQYPALLWPNANLSYTIQPESYSLLNPMEFAMDYYGSLDFTYWMNGLIFNRIPLVKKAKLREIVSFKMLMGGLTKKNDPQVQSDLYMFPTDGGISRLTAKPYMELGVGIDNILTCLRLDYVWRLTYRDAPNINHSGLRLSLHFAF